MPRNPTQPLLLSCGLLLLAATAACRPAADTTGTPATDHAAAGEADATGPAAAAPAETSFAADFAAPIERSQGAEAWYGADAVAADLSLEFGGHPVLDGHLLLTPEMGRVRLERSDGTVVVWDGSQAWVSPADADFPRARFHVFTWPYFLAAAMKLRDPGSHLEDLGRRTMDGVDYDVARLTFAGGTGDTPDDWYVLYRDPQTSRLAAMGYVVTWGRDLEQAEAEPHAIVYDDFTPVGGAMIPTTWRFYRWSLEDGIQGDPIGRLELTGVHLVESLAELPEGVFARPADARAEEMPQAGPDARTPPGN